MSKIRIFFIIEIGTALRYEKVSHRSTHSFIISLLTLFLFPHNNNQPQPYLFSLTTSRFMVSNGSVRLSACMGKEKIDS